MAAFSSLYSHDFSRIASRAPEARVAEIRHWLDLFLRGFFANQFKRSTLPNGPKITSGGSLSPRRLAGAVRRPRRHLARRARGERAEELMAQSAVALTWISAKIATKT